MKPVNRIVLRTASMALATMLSLAGCGDFDRHDRDRDHSPNRERRDDDRRDNDRQDSRRDNDRPDEGRGHR